MLQVPDREHLGQPDLLFSVANVAEAQRVRAWLEERIEKSKKLGKSELLSEVVTITPAMAEVILADCNHGNRTIRPTRAQKIANAIIDGRWKLTSQGISFSRDGQLNNGQHKLQAIVLAGKSVRVLVVFGEHRDVFDVLDTGATRGGADTLHVAGYKNTKALSAAARLLELVTSQNPLSNATFSNDVLKEIVERNPRLEDATTDGCNVAKRLKCAVSATTTAFYLIRQHSQHERRLDSFVERLMDGAELKQKNPILILRDGLKGDEFVKDAANNAGRGAYACAAIIIAWNKWINGKSASIGSLRWDSGNEFPKPE